MQVRTVQHFICGKVFRDKVENVAPESVYAHIRPEIDDTFTFASHLRILPVEVGLLNRKRMEIILVGRRIVFPRISAEASLPVGERLFRPDIVIVIRIITRSARFPKPAMLRRGVINN